MKICSLGVDSDSQYCGIGTALMDYIKMYFLDDNKTGCRYLTVDAHKDAVNFYIINGFKTLLEEADTDSVESTCLMFYDLMTLKP